ncbi:LysR family transcriptional regulator [Psychrobium sp. MM17-31]|uniref:LysR family transcriptional regulator n=1 Tax=Psychrobium sp. MM17-31 TaxID=2917758 RepID=UPI001EF42A15|nr:LysR family transcriptional regulator [Psychrobium sp. MM17-31]MCG7529994.1 LysR family transcriptional regulator [Psychrobium sp. MM17-31]
MDKLDCMKMFTQVARLGSFTAVANEQNLTQGAVSKKIAWLENTIGFSLFHRTSRKISLTNSGEKYLGYCVQLLEEMLHTEQNIKGELSEAIGELKISVPSAFATQRLAIPISKFMESNPNVKINVSVSDKQVNLYEDDIDIAIRAAQLEDSGLKAKKILDHQLCYFASREYIKGYGKPENPYELIDHRCITYSLSNPSDVWQIGNKKYAVNETSTSDSPELIVKLALAGSGIAAMPKWMVEKHLLNGQLIELFRAIQKPSLPMYALYKNVEFLPYKIRAFIDFIDSYFDDDLNNG